MKLLLVSSFIQRSNFFALRTLWLYKVLADLEAYGIRVVSTLSPPYQPKAWLVCKKSFLKFLDIKFITTVYQPWNHKQISFWFKRMQSATCWQRLSFPAPRFSSQTSNQVNWHYGRKLRKVKVKHFLNFSSQPRPFQHFTLKTPAATASSRKLLWLGFELISGFNPGLIDQGVSSGNSTNSFALKKKMPLLTSIYWKQKKTCFISPFGDIKKLLLRISWIVMFHNFHIRFIPRNERTWIWFHYSIQAKKHHTYRYFWTQEIPLNLQKASERWLRPNLTSML